MAANDISDLLLRIDATTEGLRRELKSAEKSVERTTKTIDKRVQSISRSMNSLGRSISVGVTLPMAAASTAAIKLAVDAEETANKFNVVFRGSVERSRQELQRLTQTIPLTVSQMEAMAAGIQDMLVPMGVVRSEAANMSVQMVELAGDMASFNNVSPEQVLMDIQSALAGSSEPMRKYGVDTRVAALEQIALKNGLMDVGEELDNTSTAQAVLMAIMEDSSDAMGDAEDTIESTANQMKFLQRDIRQIAEDLGKEFLPVFKDVLIEVRGWVTAFKELSPETQNFAVKAALVTAALGPLLIALSGVLNVVLALTRAVPILRTTLSTLLGPAGVVIGGIAILQQLTSTARTYAETTDLVTSSVDDMTEAQLRNLAASIRSTKEVVNTNLARLASMNQTSQQVVRQTETQMKRYEDLETQLAAVNAEIDALNDSNGDLGDTVDDVNNALGEQTEELDDTRQISEELVEELTALGEANAKLERNVQSLIDELFPAEAALREMESSAQLLDVAYQQGLITIEQYIEATDRLTGSFHQVSESSKQAAEDSQREFRGLERFLSSSFMTMGDDADNAFDSIANSFKDMLNRMLADAAASGIMSMFRGDGFMSGFMGGDMGSLLGGMMGGGSSGGGSLWNTVGDTQSLLSGAGGAKGLWSGIQGGMGNALSGMASAWPLAVIMGMVQSGKLYDQGVRPDMGRMADASQFQRTGSLGATAQSGQFEAIDSALAGLGLDGKTAAILSGSTFHQALWEGIYGAILGGPEATRGGVQMGFEGGRGANFSNWANITDSGGIFSGTDRRIETSELDSEFNRTMHRTYDSVIGNVRDLYEEIGIAVDEGGLRGVEIATKRIGAWGKSEQTEEEIAEEITQWFGDLQDAVLKSVISGMDMETLQAMGQLSAVSRVDPVAEARRGRESDAMTQVEQYQRVTESLRTMVNQYDGTVASSQQLTQALQGQQETAFQLANAYMAAQQSASALFSGLEENIRTSLMGQEELYNYQRSQVHALTESIQSMADPQQILSAAESIESRMSSMWGRLDEAQREEMGEGFLNYISETDRIVQNQLEEGLNNVSKTQQDISEMVRQSVRDAAQSLNAAARRQEGAANQMSGAAAQMSAAVEQFGQYMSGRGRGEVN